MAQTIVIYHSGYGHTQRVAQSVAQGANAELIAIDADGNIPESQWAALDAAPALLTLRPSRPSSTSWTKALKTFADGR